MLKVAQGLEAANEVSVSGVEGDDVGAVAIMCVHGVHGG
jgi:hypothetical protein